jgi:signal transduction histidine kinase
MLAHELKTPLATLQMWLNSGQLPHEQMERAIRDMNLVIERCVHAGQISDEGLKPVWQTVRAEELTAEIIADCRHPERVQFEADAKPSMIKTDVQMLTIALGNLLDNACKYSAPHTPIHLALRAELKDGQEGWRWTISNQVGQAGEPNPEQLFNKYYRSPHARRQSGSGLGLFLVKRLLELLGGHIWYAPTSDQISFSFWLPA